MPNYSLKLDYNHFKFNLKTIARHTLALVFENSITAERESQTLSNTTMGTKIDIETSGNDSEMENQPSFWKKNESQIFFACGILFILIHLAIPVMIIVNSIKEEEKSMPIIKQINSNSKTFISVMNSFKDGDDVTSLKKEPPVLQEIQEQRNLDTSKGEK